MRTIRSTADLAEIDFVMWLQTVTNGSVPFEDIAAHVTRLQKAAEARGRIDELERIQAVTLDAATDVWSTTDDGQMVSLPDRLTSLGKR